MAIYHLEAKIVSRGTGRSAVAAAAYMSCSQITNDYDGVQHDYTRKQGLVWEQVFLPPMAPAQWQDRSALWNAVEETEKSKDSRLAREFVVALPVELSKEDNIALLTDFVQNSFVADRMCADVCIHDTDGHNPHAHILLTVRPLNEDGTWQYKTEKEYLCVRSGEEQGFTAAEYKTAQNDGWEKQYPYKVGKKKEYMTPSAAEAQGYERTSKYPKSTKYGRQNPTTERWNSEEQLVLWRQSWAETANHYLARVGLEETIDHRSHAARELDEQPTIHEGVIARALEAKGVPSDRCEINRQIKADNKLLRELKAQMAHLLAAVKNTLPVIANAMETLRRHMIILSYQLRHTRWAKDDLHGTLQNILPEYRKYSAIVQKTKSLSKQRKALLSEKAKISKLNVIKHAELARQIAVITEDMEELRSEKAMLINFFNKYDDAGMKEIRQWITGTESSLQKLEQAETHYSDELNRALAEYKDLVAQSADLDTGALAAECQTIRPAMTKDAMNRIQNAYGQHYSYDRMRQAKRDIETLLGEEPERKPSVREQLKQPEKQAQQQTSLDKRHHDNLER